MTGCPSACSGRHTCSVSRSRRFLLGSRAGFCPDGRLHRPGEQKGHEGREPKWRVDRIPLFPLDVVLFPGELFGLHVFEERYVLMAEEVLAEGLPIGIVLAKQDQPEDRLEYEPEEVGTAAIVLAHEQIEGRYLLETVGTRRFRIVDVHSNKPYQEADVEWLDEPAGDPQRAAELADQVLKRVEGLGGEVRWDDGATADPVMVSHAVGAALLLDLDFKQTLLEVDDAEERLRLESQILSALT